MVWGAHVSVAASSAPSAAPARGHGWGPTPRAHVVVISAGRGHGMASSAAWGHAVKTPTPASPPGGEAAATATTHGSPASTAPLLKRHGEATVVVGLVIEVWVIRLCSSLYGSLESQRKLYLICLIFSVKIVYI